MIKKVYKRIIYRITTKKFCGAVAVDQDGFVYEFDTAPCFKWMARKEMKFNSVLSFLKRKNDLVSCKKIGEDIDPF